MANPAGSSQLMLQRCVPAGLLSLSEDSIPKEAKNLEVCSIIGINGQIADWGYVGIIGGTDCCGSCEVVSFRIPTLLSLHTLFITVKASIYLVHAVNREIPYRKVTYLDHAINSFNTQFSKFCELTAHKERGGLYILVHNIKDYEGFQKNVVGWNGGIL